MKKLSILLLYLFVSLSAFAQQPQPVISGKYGNLKLAYNSGKNLLTGYYENSTGYDPQTGESRFYCIYYLEGKLNKSKATLKTYYPGDSSGDVIMGKFNAVTNTTITIQLPEEHGGCWNVEHFTDSPVKFEISAQQSWLEIRYTIAEKTFFYSLPNEESKMKSYVLKGDILYVDKIEKDWLHVTYYGKKKNTSGWVKAEMVNPL